MIEFPYIPQLNDGLYEHQIQAKDDIYYAWNKYDKLLFQMPTGTGKTVLFISIVNDLIRFQKSEKQHFSILIIAHRTELIDQISKTLDRFHIEHGIIQGARQQNLNAVVQVASIMSVFSTKNDSNVRKLPVRYVIIDEAHHSMAMTYQKLFDAFPLAKFLGVTATPWRLSQESFGDLYEVLITSPQITDFIKKKRLSGVKYFCIRKNTSLLEKLSSVRISTTKDYVQAELESAFNIDLLNKILVETYLKYANGLKGIVYAISRSHAQAISKSYNDKGIASSYIDCETKAVERKQILEQFRTGDIKVMVNVDIFTEGFDCPEVEFIQLARPTRSLSLYLQQVGRGLRIHKNKKKAIILDNAGLFHLFGLPHSHRRWNDLAKGIGDGIWWRFWAEQPSGYITTYYLRDIFYEVEECDDYLQKPHKIRKPSKSQLEKQQDLEDYENFSIDQHFEKICLQKKEWSVLVVNITTPKGKIAQMICCPQSLKDFIENKYNFYTREHIKERSMANKRIKNTFWVPDFAHAEDTDELAICRIVHNCHYKIDQSFSSTAEAILDSYMFSCKQKLMSNHEIKKPTTQERINIFSLKYVL